MPGVSSRNTRVLIAIALLALSSLALGGIVYIITDRDGKDIQATTERLDTLEATANQVSELVLQQEAAVDDYVLSRDPTAVGRYRDAVAAENLALAPVATHEFQIPDVEAALTNLGTASAKWRSEVADPAITAAALGDRSGLDKFAKVAPADDAPIQIEVKDVNDVLDTARASLEMRRSNAATLVITGVVVGFSGVLVAFGIALVVVRRFGRTLELDAVHAGILNRFTEVTSFAIEDRDIAAANLAAIGRLVHPDASVTHILNRSLDRGVPEASTGDAIADVLPMHELSKCAGMVRGTLYVSDDLADELSVRCHVYPAKSGTLACIPLTSGETVGAVHLYWAKPRALPLALRAPVSRIAEHAAMAIGNRRLLAALHGQANTDPRTGLANSRSFDLSVEQALSARAAHDLVSVLMLDLDQFKLFNDRHGHPAGDEALRSFAAVLRSCMRDGDVAARYGGEEFAVMLPGVDRQAAITIAERIRSRTESTIISLAPGLSDRMTVSIGVASAPEQGLDRVTLLRLADEALYKAKAAGRNRVEAAGGEAEVEADPSRSVAALSATPVSARARGRPKGPLLEAARAKDRPA